MDINLSGKVTVVTGGTEGIGLAIAETFAKAGADVAICSRSTNKVNDAKKYLKDQGYEVLGESVDVSQKDSLHDFAQNVENKYGGIDIWVNNAGIIVYKKIIDTTDDEWQQIMNINVNSVFYGSKIAAEMMIKRGGGVLINASSFASIMPSLGGGAYAATKAAISSMTRSLAAELAPHNIRVNGYIPGVIVTKMTEPGLKEKKHVLESQLAMQKTGEPQDVANAVLFIASDKASYITGTCIEVSGGKFCVQNPQDAWS